MAAIAKSSMGKVIKADLFLNFPIQHQQTPKPHLPYIRAQLASTQPFH